jgi:hypothetical protein
MEGIMITAYLVGISVYHEDEDIEIRYRIFENEQLICKKSVFKEYKKPLIVGQVALVALLKELEPYKDQEITIFINDPALNEQIKGTSTSKNKDVIKMTKYTKEKLNKFRGSIIIKDVSTNKEELDKWDDILTRPMEL